MKQLINFARNLLDRLEGLDVPDGYHDPVASRYVMRIRAEADGLCEYLRSRGDQVSADKADRIAARIYKPLRQVDGIVNGFYDER